MNTARKVLLVDDDEELRTSLKDQLVLHDEFEVFEANTASKGIEAANGAASHRKGRNIMTTTSSSRPTHRVFAVTRKDQSDKGKWHEIGALWPHKDGKGFNLKLDLLPTGNAELVIRAATEQAEGGAA